MEISEVGLLYYIGLKSLRLLLRLKFIKLNQYNKLNNKLKSCYLKRYTNCHKINNVSSGTIGTFSPLWVCWWQGENNMPDIVKICYKNIRKNSCNHPVILITENNYREYTEIPDYIIEKVKNGNISITHLSDILRVSLLYEHGGIWIDSTILLQKPIDSIINTDFKFYSYRHKVGKNHPIISNGLWTTFFLSSCKGNEIMNLMRLSFYKYWKVHNSVLDYFLMDFIFFNIYKQYKEYEYQITNIPEKEFNLLELQKRGNEKYVEEVYNRIIDDSDFQKISYKNKYNIQTIDGEKTYYSYIQKLI